MTASQKLAIHGGAPYRTAPFTSWPIHDEAEAKAVADVANSGKWWRCAYGAGELEKKSADQVAGRSRVEVFEERFAAAHRAKYGIAVTNGSAALDIAVRAVGVQPGDEVITTPYTFVSTSMCIMNNFGVPVYTDIEADSYNMDAGQIESLITERTKAILPVHFSGNLCDMERIMAIARKHGLPVIEDAAHAHGVEYKGEKFAGTFGDLSCFSFQESKNLPTGEGGMLLTDSDELYERAFSMHHLGRLPEEVWYKHFHQAWNCRMNEFTAAIGIVQLDRLFEQNARRMENHTYLMGKLAELPGLTPCRNLPGLTKHSQPSPDAPLQRGGSRRRPARRRHPGGQRRGNPLSGRLHVSQLRQPVHVQRGNPRAVPGGGHRPARLPRLRRPLPQRTARLLPRSHLARTPPDARRPAGHGRHRRRICEGD